jgi:hypothetical protein
MDPREHLRRLAGYIVQEITPARGLKDLTRNSALLGHYAEEAVRSLVRRTSHPLNVATGGIVHEGNHASCIPQLDTIFWSACPAPPVFCAGNFAIVPRHTAFGYLEVKRSAYSGSGLAIQQALAHADELIPYRCNERPLARGVVCLREHGQRDKTLDDLVEEGLAFVLMDESEAGEVTPNLKAVMDLVNFIADVKNAALSVLGGIKVAIHP